MRYRCDINGLIEFAWGDLLQRYLVFGQLHVRPLRHFQPINTHMYLQIFTLNLIMLEKVTKMQIMIQVCVDTYTQNRAPFECEIPFNLLFAASLKMRIDANLLHADVALNHVVRLRH